METLLLFLTLVVVALVVTWLRTFPFREKRTKEPERTARAEVIARRIQSGANRSGHSVMGYNHVVTFRLKGGKEFALYTHDVEYGALREGMTGQLTWKGRYFVSFDTENGI